ncbi:MAG TPA: methyltransferase domain-containing protein [Candidatus Brocadiia bacterium]|nr:methyltransferase domain-containing protein [Candidatus Brocadiia bacterium]
MMPYARMAEYFGAIFPCTADHQACYDMELPDAAGRRVLDVGFGSGAHLEYLALRGADIYGLEAEAELVRAAQQRWPALASHFKRGGMDAVSSAFPNVDFDLTLLVGNTLAHARNLGQASRTLEELAKATALGGRAVVSVVNYDRILEQGVTELPAIEGETANGKRFAFYRSYDLAGAPERVVFSTRLETPEGVVEGRRDLFPILRAQLVDVATAAFNDVSVFGGYRHEAWSLDAFSTVVIGAEPRL